MGSVDKQSNFLLIERTGEIVDEQKQVVYRVGRFLGKGGFARCYEVLPNGSTTTLAAKIVSRETIHKSTARSKMVQEIRIQRELKHANVVRMLDHFTDALNVCCVLELCPNGTLNDVIRRRRALSEEEARYFIGHVAEGLKFLRDSNIIHRDIKPANLFIDSNMVLKIGDFGLAIYDSDKRSGCCGTPNYMAPEVFEKREYSFEVDVWALGCVTYCMLVGKPPFDTGILEKTSQKIRRCDYILPSHLSDSARKLITDMLHLNREERLRIHEVQSTEFFNVGYYPTSLPREFFVRTPTFDQGAYVLPPPESVVDESTGLLYRTEGYLYTGQFGNIYSMTIEGEDQLFEAMVIDKKRISQTEGLQERIVEEILALSTVNHLNIVTLMKHITDGDSIYLLYEPCISYPLSRLLKRRRRLCEEEARFYMNQIAEGLRYLHHDVAIVHGDISTDSVCLNSEMNIKICNFGLAICNFGLAVRVETSSGDVSRGLPKHIAPELHETGSTYEADMWALGCTLYELLTGGDMMGGSSLSALDISTPAEDIIARLTDTDREQRLRVDELPGTRFFRMIFCPESMPTSTLSTMPEFSTYIASQDVNEAQEVY
uniref:Polo kinase n=1 Tax=Steinernema glaseri TaxID=37863 RepID=A0A1I7YYR0_9BILA